MKENNFSKYLTNFLSLYLPGHRNVSVNTIASYRDAFKLLLVFCDEIKGMKPEKITLPKLTKDLIIEFLTWLENERKSSIATRNQRLAALHAFFRYIQKENPENLFEIQKILTIPYKKKSKPMVPYLTANELKILLEQPDLKTKDGRRDLVLLAVLYDTAARVQELVDLRIRDVRLTSPSVITLHGKGNKTRLVPVMEKTRALLRQYIGESKLTTGLAEMELPLFYNQQFKMLSRWGVPYIINKYVDIAKLDPHFTIDFPVTPHVFRHSKAMHLLQANVNLIYIRDFLGHVDVATTEVYVRADSEMKRKALENAYLDLIPDELPKWEKDGALLSWLNNLCN
jgi:site-specific recombinase XerD